MNDRRGQAGPRVAPTSNGEVVDQYLAALGRRLHGPKRVRAAVLDEIRGGLEDATDAFTSDGVPEPSAAQAAAAQLGEPDAVAHAFAGELATGQARRVLWAFLLTGPLVGVWWFLLLVPRAPEPQLGIMLAAIPVLPLVAAAVATAIVVLATTGSMIRWLPEAAPGRALTAAALVGVACIAGDLGVLSVLITRALTGSAVLLSPGLATMAVVASGIRLPSAAWATGACLRTIRDLRGEQVVDRPRSGAG